jgi:ubiquinone/menaquinone biosynthesis C-methylase UbiE
MACEVPEADPVRTDSSAAYTYKKTPSAGGTGKVYMGREIAEMTEAEEAAWLERPQRAASEFPDRVVAAMDLESDDVVADIGAGTGYYTFRLAPRVPDGKVLAVDIQPAMLDTIRTRAAADTLANVVPILGSPTDPNLPDDSVDVALIVFSYTEFSHPREMVTAIREALVPGGRLVLVEYRGEDSTLPVDRLHRITQEQARREMAAVGLRWIETRDVLPQHHFMVFEKPPTSVRSAVVSN